MIAELEYFLHLYYKYESLIWKIKKINNYQELLRCLRYNAHKPWNFVQEKLYKFLAGSVIPEGVKEGK